MKDPKMSIYCIENSKRQELRDIINLQDSNKADQGTLSKSTYWKAHVSICKHRPHNSWKSE